MKASFFQLMTGAAIVANLGSGVFTPAQAIQIFYGATLNGANEVPPNGSLGTGSVQLTYDNVLNTLRVVASFSGLTGNVTAAHIHSATAVAGTGTAGVATTTPTFAGFPSGVTSGSYDNTLDLTSSTSYRSAFITANGGTTAGAQAALISSFDAGTSYFNIHTTSVPGGEIRGFITATVVPWETDALSVLGSTVLCGMGIWGKNKLSRSKLK